MKRLIGILHPVFENVLQLERLCAEACCSSFRILGIERENRFLGIGTDLYGVVPPFYILYAWPGDGDAGRLVSRTTHLVDVPWRLQVAEVADTGVRAEFLRLLVVPEGEGVVVAVGVDNGESLVGQGIEVVLSEVAAHIAVTAVVVIPCLASHLDRYKNADKRSQHGGYEVVLLEQFLQPFCHSSYSQSNPNGESVERAGVSIVTFTRLLWRLVQVKNDGETRHEEEEEYHPELLYAAPSATECLPAQANNTENQRQAVEHVVPLVLLQFGRQQPLVSHQELVDEVEARNPIAVLNLTIAADVVLTSHEVPEEVAPVHEVHLVIEEEGKVFRHGGDGKRLLLAAIVVAHLLSLDTARHPLLVEVDLLCPIVGVGFAVHAWENHVLRVNIFVAVAHDYVAVFFVGTGLFLLAVDGGALLGDGHAIAAIDLPFHL